MLKVIFIDIPSMNTILHFTVFFPSNDNYNNFIETRLQDTIDK